MAWRDAAKEGMPSPRKSEPASLRGDILDELADHLALAAERESRQSSQLEGEDRVWSCVLDKFGDPTAIARQLWWDAMRERLMREWIQTGAIVVGMVILVVFTVLGFNQMQTSNLAILSALESASESQDDPMLCYLDVKVSRGSIDGPPAAELLIRIHGNLFGDPNDYFYEWVGEDGIVSIGPIQPGAYRISCITEMYQYHSENNIFLFGGKKTFQIVAPPDSWIPVQLDTEFPNTDNEEYIIAGARLGWRWTDEESHSTWVSYRDVLFSKNGIWVPEETNNRIFPQDFWSWRLNTPEMTPVRKIEELNALGEIFLTQFSLYRDTTDHLQITEERNGKQGFAQLINKDGSAYSDDTQLTYDLQTAPDAVNRFTLKLPETLEEAYRQETKIYSIHTENPDLSPEDVFRQAGAGTPPTINFTQ